MYSKNISSLAESIPGLIHLTRMLATTCADAKIRVNCIGTEESSDATCHDRLIDTKIQPLEYFHLR